MISLEWTKGLSPEDAKTLTEQFEHNYSLFESLQGLLDARILAISKERISRNSFEVAAWSEYQAFLNGKELALLDLKTLITLRD